MNYELRILPRAEKELGGLDSKPYQAVKAKIYGLRENPRPPGCRRLTNVSGWRLRVGDYRVVYEIDDITVLRIAHRREVYK